MTLIRDERIEGGGDDLGTIWYDFYGMTMEKTFDWIKRKGFVDYSIIKIETTKKYWLFGPYVRIHVVLEKTKITKPHKYNSEFFEVLNWIFEHSGSKIEFERYNDSVALTLHTKRENESKYFLKLNPEEYDLHFANSIQFLDQLWDNLHPKDSTQLWDNLHPEE